MSFLLLSPAAFQEVPDPVVNEEFPQSSFNFPLFILVDLCYACSGKSLLGIVVGWRLHYTIPVLAGGGCAFFGKRGLADEMKESSGGFL